MKKASIALLTLCCSVGVNVQAENTSASQLNPAQDLNPSQGYTFEQSQALTKRFDISSWNIGSDMDFTRYAYVHIPRFFPTETIARAGQVAHLKTKNHKKIGSVQATINDSEMSLEQWTDNHLDGVIVVHKGNIIYEKYPRMRAQDKHVWWSVSKSVTGTLVGLLEQQGKVDTSKSVADYIPELSGTDWQDSSVLDVLEMASGMSGLEADNPRAYTDPDSPYLQYEASLGIAPRGKKFTASTYDYIASLKRQKATASKHEYTSVNTFVLGWLVEKVTNMNYADAVSHYLWQHIGAEADAGILLSKTGAPGSHGLIYSTLRDLARYGMLFTPSHKNLSKNKVIPKALVEKIQTPLRPEIYAKGMLFDAFNYYALGSTSHTAYQWDFVTRDGDFGKSGFHGQTLYISPSKDLVVASFATGKKYDTFKFARAFAQTLK